MEQGCQLVFFISSAFDILREPYGVKLVHIQGVSPKTFETLGYLTTGVDET
jgi:hypothetical protein